MRLILKSANLRCLFQSELRKKLEELKMALSKEVKAELVKQFGANETDTGSTKVQIAILTKRIAALTEHLKNHGQDDYEGYKALIKELGIRK